MQRLKSTLKHLRKLKTDTEIDQCYQLSRQAAIQLSRMDNLLRIQAVEIGIRDQRDQIFWQVYDHIHLLRKKHSSLA